MIGTGKYLSGGCWWIVDKVVCDSCATGVVLWSCGVVREENNYKYVPASSGILVHMIPVKSTTYILFCLQTTDEALSCDRKRYR